MLHVTADSVTAIALLSISVTLAYLVVKGRRDKPFRQLDLLLAALMVTGGAGHIIGVFTSGAFAGGVKIATTAVSLVVAVALPFLMPSMLAVARKRHQTEESLAMFRRLIDGTNDGIQVIDPETHRLLDVNETSCRALGYTREELLKLTIFDIDPNGRELVSSEACRPAGVQEGVIFESRHRRKDGSTFPVEINVRQIQLDRQYSIAVVRDITERKRAEEALLESEERLRLAAAAGRDLPRYDGRAPGRHHRALGRERQLTSASTTRRRR